MAVLVEALSVVVQVAAIERSYPGGMRRFEADCPNATFACDDRLVRIGFMVPQDVGLFIRRLRNAGILYFNGTQAIDLAVVDQYSGILEPCEWLEFRRVELFAGTVSIVHLKGESWASIALPAGWKYENSMSNPANHQFIPNDTLSEVEFLRRERGNDVVRLPNGEESLIGRPFAVVRDVPGEAEDREVDDSDEEDVDDPQDEEPEDDGIDHNDTEWRICDRGPHWATLATFGMGGEGSEFEEEGMLYAHCVDCSSEVLASFGATSSVTVQPLAETMKWANLLLDQFKYRDLNTRWFHARLYDNV